ncbi:MAG: c-type cytochrome [Rhodoferax sp.]|nr:c-type cytochrome [Rhodoferax sp.]
MKRITTPLAIATATLAPWPRLSHLLALALLTGLGACGGGGGGDSPASVAVAAENAAVQVAAQTQQQALVSLGQQLFNDPKLSTPAGTACASCHQAASGFSSLHGSTLGVAAGSLPTSLGLRSPSQAAYSAAIPRFGFVTSPQGTLIPAGGQFWDGRADTLAAQALLPLLNPLEMNNADQATVVSKVAAAPYASLFTRVFGAAALSNTNQAFNQIGQAIQAFEQSAALQAFTSKYDAMVQGKAVFSAAEQNGMALFQSPANGCAACHRMNPASSTPQNSPFTNHIYVVEGIPRNPQIPRNADASFFDLGLCGPERSAPVAPVGVQIADYCGAFQVPSLRNVALRPALMHNGFFRSLTDVVNFYSTRNSDPQRWYGPSGIPNDLPAQYQANLETRRPPFNHRSSNGPLLTAAQVSDVVAFLNTLTDGFLAASTSP